MDIWSRVRKETRAQDIKLQVSGTKWWLKLKKYMGLPISSSPHHSPSTILTHLKVCQVCFHLGPLHCFSSLPGTLFLWIMVWFVFSLPSELCLNWTSSERPFQSSLIYSTSSRNHALSC